MSRSYATVLLLVLLLLPLCAYAQLSGSIIASPGDVPIPPLFHRHDAIPLQAVPPPSIDNRLPLAMVPYLDPVAQYVQAWHSLSVGAQRAGSDLTHVLAAVVDALDVVARHRHKLTDATPWVLRLFLQQVLRL